VATPQGEGSSTPAGRTKLWLAPEGWAVKAQGG